MNDDLNGPIPPAGPPDEALLRRIHAQMIASSAKPVYPLPSNAILILVGLGVFAVVAFGLAALTGFKAVAALSAAELSVYYGMLAAFALLFARAVIERMIPGERRMVNTFLLWALSLLLLSILSVSIFTDHSLHRFAADGIPCLRLGLAGALLSGLIGWRLVRRGYLVSPRETLLLYGFFAGLTGVAVLALHCPIRNSLHVMVWHLGAMPIAGMAGWLLARFVEHAD